MKLSINDTVRVRLNDSGRAVLRSHYDHMAAMAKAHGGSMPPYKERPADKDGWSEWPLWELMARLGPVMQQDTGKFLPFDPVIEVTVKQ